VGELTLREHLQPMVDRLQQQLLLDPPDEVLVRFTVDAMATLCEEHCAPTTPPPPVP